MESMQQGQQEQRKKKKTAGGDQDSKARKRNVLDQRQNPSKNFHTGSFWGANSNRSGSASLGVGAPTR